MIIEVMAHVVAREDMSRAKVNDLADKDGLCAEDLHELLPVDSESIAHVQYHGASR